MRRRAHLTPASTQPADEPADQHPGDHEQHDHEPTMTARTVEHKEPSWAAFRQNRAHLAQQVRRDAPMSLSDRLPTTCRTECTQNIAYRSIRYTLGSRHDERYGCRRDDHRR